MDYPFRSRQAVLIMWKSPLRVLQVRSFMPNESQAAQSRAILLMRCWISDIRVRSVHFRSLAIRHSVLKNAINARLSSADKSIPNS